mgnify:CR=1 FL=1|tara:strand:+ start:163208 stop:163432 length:225 start_codon:yes stop_codon:yes gene_type:complete
MNSMFLDRQEMVELTNRTRRDAQIRALRYMGIEHRTRPDGSLVVLRSHLEQVLGGSVGEKKSKPKEIEPDWSAI